MYSKRIGAIVGAVLVIGAVAGCSYGGGTVAGAPVPEPQGVASVNGESGVDSASVSESAALVATASPELGPIVTDGDGMTLYRFDKDTARPSQSNCDGACATAWPPVLTSSADAVEVDGVDRTLVGTVTRSDGSRQVTLAGWPLYRYANDAEPGDTNGQGAGGNWFVATPEGKKATGKPANAVALVVMRVGSLGEIVTDREGMTLYRFDNDRAEPSESNCEGDCAAVWPPVLTPSAEAIEVKGLDPKVVGTVKRSDGSLQVTIGGWPVYRFAKDKVPCDTKGHGVNGTWFAVTAQGNKAPA